MTAQVLTENDSDKRIARRMRTLKSAKIVYMNQWSLIDCAIKDMSATGVKIMCHDQMAVPNEFRLLMIQDNTLRNCKVMWRRAEFIGVHFTSGPTPAPPRKI